MENKKIPLIAVVGPTASGKTTLSIEIAKRIGGEIVSADSMQIYKGISVASAAPTEEEMQGIPHYMLEFLNLGDSYSVADYVSKANEIICEINNRGKIPVLVGGTGLYVDSLTNGITFTEQKADPELRQSLENEFDALGGEQMLKRLSEFDPVSAERLNPTDRRRIIRAFEIYKASGITKTRQDELSRENPSPYKTVFIGITYRDREKLYERINRRVDLMLDCGLLKEAQSTLVLPLGTGAAQAIGHKELHSFLRDEKTFEEAVEDLKRETRRYAKRQLTWFRRNEQINWIYADESESIIDAAMKIIEKEL